MFKVAILDMNDGTPNRGLRSIISHVDDYKTELQYEIFDVRSKREIPDLSYDIFISSGGPNDPRVGDGVWDKLYYEWIDKLVEHNLKSPNKKFVFFICHSFQMACIHFKVGELRKRFHISFGTFPCYLTKNGMKDYIFENLPNPFYIADFRNFEVVNFDIISDEYPRVLAIEQMDVHHDRERCLMAIRFNDQMYGTQFHPEAHAEGMFQYFNESNRRNQVIEEHGQERLDLMIEDLTDPLKIQLTNDTILPNFLDESILKLRQQVTNTVMI